MTKVTFDQIQKQGKDARLIPCIADTNIEQRATSILLATLTAVPDYAESVLDSIGIKVGKRTSISTFIEVEFANRNKQKFRPDGLIYLNTGKRTWSALVETKTHNNTLDEKQLESYVDIARYLGIDAVISISNQFAADPSHHPTYHKQQKTVKVLHWSWAFLRTQAFLVIETKNDQDPDQQFILAEVLRYFADKSSGIREFDSMSKNWQTLISTIRAGQKPKLNSTELLSAAGDWHQLSRDVCLDLSKKTAVSVKEKLKVAHTRNQIKRLKDTAKKLAKIGELTSTYDIPDAAAPVILTANCIKRSITVSMKLTAPDDRKSATARTNWLLRQLKSVNDPNIFIKAIYLGGGANPIRPICELKQDSSLLMIDDKQAAMTSFEVFLKADIGVNFLKRKIFVKEVKEATTRFYDIVGENLQAWVKKPPKLLEPSERAAQNLKKKNRKINFLARIIDNEEIQSSSN